MLTRMVRRLNVSVAVLVAALVGSPALGQAEPGFTFSDAARADYPGEIALGTGPGQPREDWFRQNGSLQVRNVAQATLTPFLPPAHANTGAAVIVAPGGAFLGLAIEEEGFRIAKWLADHGIAAFVLKYRLLPTPPDSATFRSELVAVRTGSGTASFRPPNDTPEQALIDGLSALRLVRGRAAEFGIDPARTGMMGFSAGAFLTLSVARANQPDARPAFIAPIYGRQTAIDPPPSPPPMFVVLAADDPLFAHDGFGLVESWSKAGGKVEMHLYQSGGHGFGLGAAGATATEWMELFQRWLLINGLLAAKR
jgi:acetyl esterase/lipase